MRIPVVVALLAITALPACAPEDAPPVVEPGVVACYELVVLPPLPADVMSRAHALNNASAVEVVGYSKSADHVKRAVKWTYDQGGITRTVLPTLAGFDDAAANDINDNGDICGTCESGPGQLRPVVWIDGQVRDIYVLGRRDLGERAEALTISNHGFVAGYYVYAPEGETVSTARPFSYFENDINDFQNQLSTRSIIRAVDKAWLALAAGNREGEGPVPGTCAAAFSYAYGDEYLPHLAYPPSDAYGVSTTGEGRILVVGTSVGPPGRQDRAVLWVRTLENDQPNSWEVIDLGAMEGADGTKAKAVNRHGLVVGHSRGAFVWSEETGMVDLRERVLPGDIEDCFLVSAYDINDPGWICGSCKIGEDERGFLLVPRICADVAPSKSSPSDAER